MKKIITLIALMGATVFTHAQVEKNKKDASISFHPSFQNNKTYTYSIKSLRILPSDTGMDTSRAEHQVNLTILENNDSLLQYSVSFDENYTNLATSVYAKTPPILQYNYNTKKTKLLNDSILQQSYFAMFDSLGLPKDKYAQAEENVREDIVKTMKQSSRLMGIYVTDYPYLAPKVDTTQKKDMFGNVSPQITSEWVVKNGKNYLFQYKRHLESTTDMNQVFTQAAQEQFGDSVKILSTTIEDKAVDKPTSFKSVDVLFSKKGIMTSYISESQQSFLGQLVLSRKEYTLIEEK
ncbi:hypothetical protein SAMN05216474_0615 [Lishizhenia tianjinensis]|uniref:DUF4163 domain-containing protein n=1 Tax=Lishizhenia tianjinensis TaxID=477690 RepID=A0A1I6Y2A3_9FLAO|nr:hypothetical protein [Lishizhenia tianjinensis]SFT44658.1 hypothetical protein SAMN05216474_0615 [Lishizhenia tianjinensis]